jgi:hypothetical protein
VSFFLVTPWPRFLLIAFSTYRQLASLSAKVQAYEDVIRKLSDRFGVSDEQLVNIALVAVRSQICLQYPSHL